MKIPEMIKASREKNEKDIIVLTEWKPDLLELKECLAAVIKADTYAGFTADEKEAWLEFIKDSNIEQERHSGDSTNWCHNDYIEGNYVYGIEIVDLEESRCGNNWEDEKLMKIHYLQVIEKLKGLMHDINNRRKKECLFLIDWQQYFGKVSFFGGKFNVGRDGDLTCKENI